MFTKSQQRHTLQEMRLQTSVRQRVYLTCTMYIRVFGYEDKGSSKLLKLRIYFYFITFELQDGGSFKKFIMSWNSPLKFLKLWCGLPLQMTKLSSGSQKMWPAMWKIHCEWSDCVVVGILRNSGISAHVCRGFYVQVTFNRTPVKLVAPLSHS